MIKKFTIYQLVIFSLNLSFFWRCGTAELRSPQLLLSQEELEMVKHKIENDAWAQ